MQSLKLGAVGMLAWALSACVVAPYPGGVVYANPGYASSGYPAAYASPGYDTEIAVTSVAPPPPYAEVVPVAPFLGALWIAGYWGWYGGRHQWVGGHYEHARPGYAWAPHRWALAGNAWHLHGGGWVRR